MGVQPDLFSPDDQRPEGLLYVPDFITSDEEHDIIDKIRALPLTPFQFGAFEGKRRIASFGWRYDYTDQRLVPADAIPAWIAPLVARVENFAALPASSIRQLLCTEYDAGVGIGWHRDKPHFEDVFGLSLASTCNFRFRRKQGEKWERFTLEAEPRSLYRMSGAARYLWEHSIPPVAAPRYSITFRSMKPKRE
jgi:alkylated DNA repair dioxygenase AlkB